MIANADYLIGVVMLILLSYDFKMVFSRFGVESPRWYPGKALDASTIGCQMVSLRLPLY
jgi:hypothetical protein